MSDLELKAVHKISGVTISSIKYGVFTNTDIIALHVYKKTQYKKTPLHFR